MTKRHTVMRPPPPGLSRRGVSLRNMILAALVGFFVTRLLCGCGGLPPPRTINVDRIGGDVLEAAYRARDAWCAAPVGWCPELVYGVMGDAYIRVGDFDGEIEPNAAGDGWEVPGYGAHNMGAYIEVARTSVGVLTVEELTASLMHEFGHFGIDGHVPASPLMSAVMMLGDESPDHVDAPAAAEWCRQQPGC